MTALAAGIIAAGEGSRLRASHPGVCKPLVRVAGAPLCQWIAQSLRRAGIQDVTVLLNSRGREVRPFLETSFPDLSWHFLERDTASSWESFRLVAQTLGRRSEDFLISTVDALIAPAEMIRFSSLVRDLARPAGMALTDFVDDEKPLWADVAADGTLSALGPHAKNKSHVTAGLYYLTRDLAQKMPSAHAYDSLRQYWTGLVQAGVKISGVPLSKTLDIDRPEDILQAERFLAEKKSW